MFCDGFENVLRMFCDGLVAYVKTVAHGSSARDLSRVVLCATHDISLWVVQ